jgi:NO-binding membrane sensor protein with MHYT domain/GGDEF domain-containing protein
VQGTYDTSLVVLSVAIAMLAAFVAIEFAGRMAERAGERRRWLFAGALAMGSGIWSMHFVGMSAFELPIEISYDLAITALTWVAAVAVSALALHLVSRGGLTPVRVASGALAMGAGICVMHYGGMWAMRMDPGIGYDPLWFGISVAIAVGASAAALVIVAALKVVRSWRDVGLRVIAAMVMGLAVAGMHYSGMAAARFDPGAFCAPGNALAGDWMTAPTVVVTLVGLAIAIFFTIGDAREVARARRAARAAEQRVTQLAFTDRDTGLINRPRLVQVVTDALRQPGYTFCLYGLRVSADGNARDVLLELARSLAVIVDADTTLARVGSEQLMLMVPGDRAEAEARSARALRQAEAVARAHRAEVVVSVAQSRRDGATAQLLILHASARQGGGELTEAPVAA